MVDGIYIQPDDVKTIEEVVIWAAERIAAEIKAAVSKAAAVSSRSQTSFKTTRL
jgi:hypothetical protein